MLCLTFVVALAAAASANEFKMPDLHVTYSMTGTPGKDCFFTIPRTVPEAESQGWVVPEETKDNTLFETRCKDKDGRICFLLDNQGSIAGYQISIPRAVDNMKIPGFNYTQKGFLPLVIFGEEYYSNRIFFVSNETLLNGGRQFNNQTGEGLWLQIGDELSEIPTTAVAMCSTDFVKQNCFVRMGLHYFYKADKSMKPEEFMPWFILFDNDGVLSGFGFISFGSKEKDFKKAISPWFEDVPALAIKMIAPSSPDWVYQYIDDYGIYSHHVNFQSDPWDYKCSKSENTPSVAY